MNHLMKRLSVVAMFAFTLAACGGDKPQDFNVSLQSVEVTRVSDGEVISVETEGVNSGNLTFSAK